MNKLIAAVGLAFALAGCTAAPSSVPEVPKQEKTLPSLFGPAVSGPVNQVNPSAPLFGPGAGGPVLTPFPDAPLIGAAVSDTCMARQNQTPCHLTNEEAFIAIQELTMTNSEIRCWKDPTSWQDLLLPPVPTGECK